ncbi:hypothetical protein [Subtercola boreus]|uniref:DNA polymerase III subunit gamma/tau n=1 Tax=Subtercola boreus TaxID=120213 RepID=A0A3E0WF22_9MICO|nr:hypothetical protein [Subtercola boreus]RFA22703.1 hypothetical protein B7R24_03585 [Subtercola boreus]RFA23058.1 hypothetical protein B7R23_03580 [Subtercola boreus]RFA28811.1 hypothetical protein B7R25_03595 [Subtercola boreus]
MARDPDDDALSWGDENDPTYVAAHPAALDEDDLEEDIPVVDPFSSAALAPPLPPQAPAPDASVAPASASIRETQQAPDAHSASPESTVGVPERQASDAHGASPESTVGVPEQQAPDAHDASPSSTVGAPQRGRDAAAPAPAPSTSAARRSAEPANSYPKVADRATAGTGTGSYAASTNASSAMDDTDAAAEHELADAERETQQLGSAALITFSIIGGIFLLYTVGWLVTFIRNPVDPSGLAGIVQNAQGILAIAAPALWFIVTLLVAARRKVSVRIVWLAIGIAVLLPWPFLTGY